MADVALSDARANASGARGNSQIGLIHAMEVTLNIRAHVLLVAVLLIPKSALAQDDLSLYDERGNAVA